MPSLHHAACWMTYPTSIAVIMEFSKNRKAHKGCKPQINVLWRAKVLGELIASPAVEAL